MYERMEDILLFIYVFHDNLPATTHHITSMFKIGNLVT